MDRIKIKNLIEKSGKSVYQVQSEVGLSQGQLYRILSGRTKDIYLSTAFKLADSLGVNVEDLRKEKNDGVNTG